MSADLTPRALLAGVAIGAVLGSANLYLGLKTGFWDPGSITAAILGFALIAPVARLTGRSFTPAEHNVVQATATAMATVPSAMGTLGALPALDLLGGHPGPAVLIVWAIALSGLGLLLALPLRAAFIDRDKLPFPTGRATAEAIAAAHADAGTARRSAITLGLAAALAGAIAWFRDAVPRLIPAAWMPSAAAPLGVAFNPLLAGAGALIGPRTSIELLAGSVIAACLAAPALAAAGFAAPQDWLLWPAVGLMVGGGLVALALDLRSLTAIRADLDAMGRGASRRLFLAIAAAALAVVLVAWIGFGASPLVGVLGVALTVLLAGVVARGAGQTDVANYAAVGQLSQGVLAPAGASPAANIAGGAIPAGATSQTVAMLSTFKVASVVGGRPAALVAAHVTGIVAGALLIAPAYDLLARANGIGGAVLPAPYAAGWKGLAEVAARGLAALPPGATLAAALAAAAAVVLALLGRTRAGRFVPSPLILGLGMLLPPALVVTVLLGAVAAYLLGRRAPRWSERHVVAGASGLIAGESVLGVVIAALTALQLL